MEYESKEEAAEAPAPVDMKPASRGRVSGKLGIKGSAARIAPQPPHRPVDTASNSEDYKNYGVNPLTETAEDNKSTFAVDVDTASYAIARRKLMSGQVPPPASVRVEEFVNYFGYDYQGPTDKNMPFAVHMDAAPSPFTKGRHILRVGVQGKKLSISERKPANLVFLVDVSGSMSSPDKLGLAKRALRLMVGNLKDGDRVAMVTYAGNTRVVLESTKADNRGKILSAIDDLNSGGSTDMGSGMDLAYKLAADGLAPGVESRVIVLSDGDANVGNTSFQSMLSRIQSKVKEGVTMSAVGFGMGNYKDSRMEQLANKGNGNYYYIDSYSEAKKVFQEQLGGTLEVIAKDVKLQVEFDKDVVKRYRLVGYENRNIADHNFRNDRVDAGEIGAGHTVTAIYELELARKDSPLAIVRVRHKKPKGSKAVEHAYAFDNKNLAATFDGASKDLQFATAVIGAAEILRRSPHARGWKLDKVRTIAIRSHKRDDRRKEFVQLIGMMKRLESKLAIAD
ncbi:MAG: VWA domain-containing protein [Deltaproteobacteria bacterium]|nr:VWA domain-containing protein [Deltaproteobacteria bacterium]